MISRLALLTLLFITACADNTRDLWGHVLPAECQGDLSSVPVPVARADHRLMPHGVLGACIGCDKGDASALILIDDRLNRREFASAVRHERCHWLLASLGKPDFHARRL